MTAMRHDLQGRNFHYRADDFKFLLHFVEDRIKNKFIVSFQNNFHSLNFIGLELHD